MPEAEIHLHALVREFLHRGRDLAGDTLVDLREGDPGLHGGDEDRALQVAGGDLRQLRVVVRAAGDLRVLPEIAAWVAEVAAYAAEVGDCFGEPAYGDAVLLKAVFGEGGGFGVG